MYTKVNGSSFSYLQYLLLHLFPGFLDHLFNSCRMYSPICYQLVKRKSCNFPSDWIKSRKDYCLRCIVNNNFNPGSSLKCPDITTFPADYTTFHLIRLDMKYCYCILNGIFGCNPLNCLNHNSFSFFVSSHFCLIKYLVNI